MTKQKIELEVDNVIVQTGKHGSDIVCLCFHNRHDILTKAVGAKRAKEVYVDGFALELRITHGCGEKMANALGLKVDEFLPTGGL